MHMDKIMILTTSKFERLVKNRVAQEMMVQNVSLEKDLAQKQADITYLQNQINPISCITRWNVSADRR